MPEFIEKTLYYINNVDGVDMPPYSQTVSTVKGVSVKVEENHEDENGKKIHARIISKEEYDQYWEKEIAKQEKELNLAQKEVKKYEKELIKLKKSVAKKLMSGEKLNEDEANFVTKNIGI